MIKALTLVKVLLASLLLVGCAYISPSPQPTLRDPGMNYTEFLSRGEALFKEKFPEWYVEGVKQELVFDSDIRFAGVIKQEDGTFVMYIFEQAWNLCTVEDLASVFLHEYVHVKIWNDLEEQIPGMFLSWCRMAVHELHAYKVEIEQKKIKISSAMRVGNRMGYLLNYNKAQTFCPDRFIEDFPEPEELR
jgi:hypothetical protein